MKSLPLPSANTSAAKVRRELLYNQVLTLRGQGHNNYEIAQALAITPARARSIFISAMRNVLRENKKMAMELRGELLLRYNAIIKHNMPTATSNNEDTYKAAAVAIKAMDSVRKMYGVDIPPADNAKGDDTPPPVNITFVNSGRTVEQDEMKQMEKASNAKAN